MQNKTHIKKELKKANLHKKISVGIFALIGITYYVYALICSAIAINVFFSSILIIIVSFLLIEGFIILSEYLIINKSCIEEGTVEQFKGFGNGKQIVVNVSEKIIDCCYFKRRIKGIYIGSSVFVVTRKGAFFNYSYPLVFPGK